MIFDVFTKRVSAHLVAGVWMARVFYSSFYIFLDKKVLLLRKSVPIGMSNTKSYSEIVHVTIEERWPLGGSGGRERSACSKKTLAQQRRQQWEPGGRRCRDPFSALYANASSRSQSPHLNTTIHWRSNNIIVFLDDKRMTLFRAITVAVLALSVATSIEAFAPASLLPSTRQNNNVVIQLRMSSDNKKKEDPTLMKSALKKQIAYDQATGRFFETNINEEDCVPDEEFCMTDNDTGDLIRLTQEEKERIFLDALQVCMQVVWSDDVYC